jgi:elongation factor G
VDSKEVAFVAAGRKALLAATRAARPCLLEPIVAMEISAPAQHLGDITGDLASRRGHVSGREAGADGTTRVLAQAPLSEVANYQSRLNSLTGGQGSYTLALSAYEPVPPTLQAQLAAQFKPAED